MAFDDDDFAMVKRIGERIANDLEGYFPDDEDVETHGLAVILGEGLQTIASAIDRLTAAIEKLSGQREG